MPYYYLILELLLCITLCVQSVLIFCLLISLNASFLHYILRIFLFRCAKNNLIITCYESFSIFHSFNKRILKIMKSKDFSDFSRNPGITKRSRFINPYLVSRLSRKAMALVRVVIKY